MSVFWYFLPGCKEPPLKPSQLPAPLDEVLADASIAFAEIADGPLKTGRGVMVNANPDDPRKTPPPLDLAAAKWHRTAAGYVIGWNPADPPSPESLRRRRPIGGRPVELGDGRLWELPELHAGAANVPMGFRINAAGEPEQHVLPQYEWLCEEVAKYLAHLQVVDDDGGQWAPTYADLFAFGVRLLAQNYRLGVHECSMDVLGLFESRTVWRPMWAATGLYDAMIQKKTGD